MSNYGNEFDHFIFQNHRKVAVALALVLLINKPKNVPTESYVFNIQVELLTKISELKIEIFDNKVLEKWQQLALSSCTKCLPHNQDSISGDHNDLLMVVRSLLKVPPVITEDLSVREIKESKEAKKNAEFVQFDVQLNHAVASLNSIELRKVCQGFAAGVSEDSGFDSCGPASDSTDFKSVSSLIVRPFVTSVINKRISLISMEKLLYDISKAILNPVTEWSNPMNYYLWTYFIKVLKEAIFLNYYPHSISKFLISTLNQLWEKEDYKSVDLYYQLKIFSQLFCNVSVSVGAINFVNEKLSTLSSKLQIDSLNFDNSLMLLIEKVPFLLQLTSYLIYNWKNFCKKPFEDINNRDTTKVSEMWKRKWAEENNKKDLNEESTFNKLHDYKNSIESLKSTLENLLISSSNNFPIISNNVSITLTELYNL